MNRRERLHQNQLLPTGETAMKIEGLGETQNWVRMTNGKYAGVGYEASKLTPETLKVGQEIAKSTEPSWIITDVLGDGKFKAVPKLNYDEGMKIVKSGQKTLKEFKENISKIEETFDISGKVDTSNPIYRFYEKEMGKYLKSKYNAKEIIDDQGVSWYEVDIKPEMKGPIEAFGIGAIPLATQINQDKK